MKKPPKWNYFKFKRILLWEGAGAGQFVCPYCKKHQDEHPSGYYEYHNIPWFWTCYYCNGRSKVKFP